MDTDLQNLISDQIGKLRASLEQKLSEIELMFNGIPLYHYTNNFGLHGIISSGHLHATDVRFLNDSQELSYAQEMLKEITSNLGNTLPADERRLLSLFNSQPGPHARIFSVSFSEEQDDLSQWRGYSGGRNGFAIEFNFEHSKHETLVSKTSGDVLCLIKIVYDPEIQRQAIIHFLTACLDVFRRLKKTFNSEEPDKIANDVWFGVGNLTLDYLVRFKGEGFRLEKEWRAVLIRRYDPSAKGLNYGHLQFRLSNGAVAPYIFFSPPSPRLGPDVGKLPVTGVVIGPREEPHLYCEAVQDLLKEYRYFGALAKTRPSKVSIRF